MKFLSRLIGQRQEGIRIEEWKDERESINGLWIEDIGISENGLWILVGRRHGILQLYRWDGKRKSLPAQPDSNVVTRILYRDGRFFLCMPPYIIIYKLEDILDSERWKSTKIGSEGSRPAGAIGFFKNNLIFNTTTRYIKGVNYKGYGEKDFVLSFPYMEDKVGSVKTLGEFKGTLLIAGDKGVALYSEDGELIKHYHIPAGRSVVILRDIIYLHDGRYIYIIDKDLKEETVRELEFPSANMDISPSLRYIFLSSEEENRMIVYNLKEENIEEIQGYGYYIVRISPDGSLFTCQRDIEGDYYIYRLMRLEISSEQYQESTPDIKGIKMKIRNAKSSDELNDIEDNIKKEIISGISREVRNSLTKLLKELEEKKVSLFIKEKESKLKRDIIGEKDLREVENLIHHVEQPFREKLESLRDNIKEKLMNRYRKEIEGIKEEIIKGNLYFYKDIRSSSKVERLLRFASDVSEEEKLEGEIKKVFAETLWNRYQIRIYEKEIKIGNEVVRRLPMRKKSLRWHLRVESVDKSRRYIYFERDDGFIAEPRRFNPAVEGQHLPEWVSKYLKHLNRLAVGDRDYEFKGFEPTPWFVRNLELIVRGLKDQEEMGEGILILEGDAGTGKNFMVETLARLTNRPLFIIPCHSQMEKDELTYIYEYNPKVGTKKRYSELIRALRTDGAIIYFDEINTLPYSVVKMLNPLFDYRRSVIMSSGEVIRGNNVLLLGSMNPQHYMGVNELPQDVKSRAEIIYIDYPPFSEENLFFHCDEAMILKPHIPALRDISTRDFYFIWHKIVNNINFDVEISKDVEKAILELAKLLSIVERIRNHYKLYQSNKTEEPVNYVFSIRDSIRCVRKWVKGLDVKDAIRETVIPKVSNFYEKEIIEGIIHEDFI